MVIRFAPNKNNHKVVAEQAVWWGTNCYVNMSLINLKVSAICPVQQYPNVIKFPIRGKILKPGFRVSEKRNPGKPVFSGFEMNAILSDKNSISLWNYYCRPCAIY